MKPHCFSVALLFGELNFSTNCPPGDSRATNLVNSLTCQLLVKKSAPTRRGTFFYECISALRTQKLITENSEVICLQFHSSHYGCRQNMNTPINISKSNY